MSTVEEIVTEHQAAQNKYVEQGGLRCPKCDSVELEADTLEQDGSCAWQNITCHSCGASWTDEYQLAGYGNFNEEDAE